ncbi:MAG: hypothetical protein R3B70_18995 [Polyangiaceae bacterium]
MSVFFEDWNVSYGSPYLIEPDELPGGDDGAQLFEEPDLRFHPGKDHGEPLPPLAFVDGVRRGEASLYKHDPQTGEIIHGVAGAHARGAVVREKAGALQFHQAQVTRLVIWGGGQRPDLPPTEHGFRWQSDSIPDTAPKDLLARLHARMRSAEAELAESLGKAGYLTVIDGPLPYGRVIDAPILGYVKTHHRALLHQDHHRRVPDLAPGERTTLFIRTRHCYSCYLRLAPRGPFSGPWAGIVRVEIPFAAGFEIARREADRAAYFLPRFAGVPHKDPRAPQNLQPIGALENHLRHLLGDARLAGRAVRESVARKGAPEGPAAREARSS